MEECPCRKEEGMLFLIIGIIVILVIAILFSGYKKAPPDTAFIISGMR